MLPHVLTQSLTHSLLPRGTGVGYQKGNPSCNPPHHSPSLPPRRYFPTILIVLLAVFNDGAMIALSKDTVTPSALPNRWDLTSIFLAGGCAELAAFTGLAVVVMGAALPSRPSFPPG